MQILDTEKRSTFPLKNIYVYNLYLAALKAFAKCKQNTGGAAIAL